MEKEEENAVSLDDEPVINYRGITVMAFIIGKKENVIELWYFIAPTSFFSIILFMNNQKKKMQEMKHLRSLEQLEVYQTSWFT